MSMKILRIVSILAPAVFIAIFESVRHVLVVEHNPMIIGNLVLFASVIVGSFFLSRSVFGTIERMQQESLRRNQELAALNSVALAVSESLNLQVVLSRALDKVLEVTGAEAGEMFLLEEDTHEMVRQVHSGLFPEAFQEKTRFRIGEGFAGTVAQFGEPIVSQDLSLDPRLLRDKVKESGFRSLACVPIKSKNAVIGAINIATLSPHRFTPEDVQHLSDIGNQIALGVENARLHEKVQGLAAMEERERIAREMHDSLAQVLGYVNTKTQAARQFLAQGQGGKAEAQLKELEDAARDTYADVREAILGLRSPITPQGDMVAVLQEHISHFSQANNIRAGLQVVNGKPPPLSSTTELQVIRIVQEALTNVRKHSGASHVWVRIQTNGDQAEIVVEDNGRGFVVSRVRSRDWLRFGLRMMRERAESVGGTLDIKASSGQGARVILRVPLAQGGEI